MVFSLCMNGKNEKSLVITVTSVHLYSSKCCYKLQDLNNELSANNIYPAYSGYAQVSQVARLAPVHIY